MAQHPGKIKLNIWACLNETGAFYRLDSSLEAISNCNTLAGIVNTILLKT
jgi:hypothetical protein